ncbi:MAG: hypothetical protein KJP02_05385, partial [Octadecabacter sp.]|nr:hypothetical protein [Octadecabacter sp.]
KTLLRECGTRQEILTDARAADQSLSARSVDSWFERNRVPGKYWLAIVQGAQSRGGDVTVDDFAIAHAPGREGAA